MNKTAILAAAVAAAVGASFVAAPAAVAAERVVANSLTQAIAVG